MKNKKTMNRLKDYLKEWNLFERLWIITFFAVNIYLFFVWHDTLIGLTASLTGMLCVVLTAKGKISSFYYGLVNILTYSYVAYQSAYYGDVMLNMLYFFPMTFLGIYYWKKNVNKKTRGNKVTVKKLSWKEKAVWFASSLIILFVYGLILRLLRGTLPFIDSATTVFSIIATIMLTKRLTDQWLYWIMVDVLSLVMWIYIFARGQTDVSMIVMWSAYLVNALYGYYNWRKLELVQNAK